MNTRTATTTLNNPTLKAIYDLLASHPDHHYTRREICEALGRGKTSQMVRLIETCVDEGFFYCVVARVNGRDCFFYRINDFSDPAVIERIWK